MALKYEIQVGSRMFLVESDKGEAHVRLIAHVVEQRMQELAVAFKTADSVRLALMTALTFAEEACEQG